MRQLFISKSITKRDSESLEKYLQEIGRIGILTPEREVELAKMIQDGDEAAVEELINANLRFVVSVAKQYSNQGLSLSDLISEGNLGLIKAAQRFDHTLGFKFISYAVWWIRQSIIQAIAENSRMVRLPLNKVGLKNKVQKTAVHFEQLEGWTPSADYIANHLNVDTKEVEVVFNLRNDHLSIDAPVTDSEDVSLMDLLINDNIIQPDSSVSYKESLDIEVYRALEYTLNEQQRFILVGYFGIGIDMPISLEEIASRMNLTRERVRQIKDKALSILRQSKQVALLKSFMG